MTGSGGQRAHNLEPGDFDAMLSQFAACIEPLGVQVERVSSSSEAAERVATVAHELSADTVVTSSELLGPAPSLMNELGGRSLEIEAAESLVATRDAALGLSTARLAVAETGSLLLSEATEADRSVGLLSLACVFVVPIDRLVPSLSDAVAPLRDLALNGGAYASFVTGPSRTADIELSLTIGVQGPARVAVVFVDELT